MTVGEKSAFVGAIRRSLARVGDRRMVTEKVDFALPLKVDSEGSIRQILPTY
jgi:hypothetical protein